METPLLDGISKEAGDMRLFSVTEASDLQPGGKMIPENYGIRDAKNVKTPTLRAAVERLKSQLDSGRPPTSLTTFLGPNRPGISPEWGKRYLSGMEEELRARG